MEFHNIKCSYVSGTELGVGPGKWRNSRLFLFIEDFVLFFNGDVIHIPETSPSSIFLKLW